MLLNRPPPPTPARPRAAAALRPSDAARAGESAINASLAWSDVGLKGSVSGRELWTGEEIGPAQAGITRVLAAHSALMYRLAPKSTMS